MTRKQALEWIRVECAQEGRITQLALRYYVENRVSYAAFLEAARKGLSQHKGAA